MLRSRKPLNPLLLAALLFGVHTSVAKAEICHTIGATQFVDAIHYCASSVLRPSRKWSYGPDRLAAQDGDGRTAWCEGVSGHGIGQSVTVRIDGGFPYRRIWIGNGYGKSRKSYSQNARPRKVRITSDLGVDTTIELIDQDEAVPYFLPEPWANRWLKLEILSVYPGSKYRDTCLDYLAPDLEYEEQLLQEQQLQATQPVEQPAAAVETPQPVVTPEPPSTKPVEAPKDDPFGELGFPDDSDLDLN